jgi:hypothetical protein
MLVARVIPPLSSLAFGMKMSEKCKSVSPSAIQVQKQWKTINTEEKLDIISQLEKGERIFYIFHNVRYTLACTEFVIMLTELNKVLNQRLKCLCSKTIEVLLESTVPKIMDVSLLDFYCIRNK